MTHIYTNKVNKFKIKIDAPTPELANEALKGVIIASKMESVEWKLKTNEN